MSENYGSDFITIVDEDGTEFELEVLTTIEYNGAEYLAVIPAVDASEQPEDLEVSILKKVIEDGEEILVTVDDETELEEVYEVLMDSLYDEEEEPSDE